MDWGILNSVATFIVGFSALYIYTLSKKHEKESASMIVVMDIRHAESVVHSILEQGSINVSIKEIMSENNWTKYKHLFARDFSQDDFSAFNKFFDSCVEMSDARQRIREVFYTTINEKARLLQTKVYSIEDLLSEGGQKKVQKYLKEINSAQPLFDPDEPKDRMMQNLRIMGTLSGTTAYAKLKRIAGEKI